MASLTDDQRHELLGLLRDGHDVESGCATLGIGADAIAGNDGLKDEIAAAFKTGTAKLRGQILQSALSQQNTAAMLKMLEAREAQQSAANETTIDVNDLAVRRDTIRRILYLLSTDMVGDARDAFLARATKAKCLHCGEQPFERRPPINVNPIRRSLP